MPKVAQRPGNVDLGTLPTDRPPVTGPQVFSDEPVGPLEQYVLEENAAADQKGRISAYKIRVFPEKLSLAGTWLANGSDPDDLGMTEIESAITVAVPFPIREWPMLITPAFNIRLLQGPRVTDLPSRLYESYVDFMWVPQFLPRLKGLVAQPHINAIPIFNAAIGRRFASKVRRWEFMTCPRPAASCRGVVVPRPGRRCDASRRWCYLDAE